MIKDGEAQIKKSLLSPGGSAANTIYGLAKLGIRSGFVGVVGDDEEGELIIKSFVKVGVDVSGIKKVRGERTGRVIGLVGPGGKRSLYVLPWANSLLDRDHIDLDYLFSAPRLHLSSFVDREQFEIQKEVILSAPDRLKISISPGLFYASKGIKELEPLLRKTEILFLNAKELAELSGEKDIALGARRCVEAGVEVVVVTLGGGYRGVCYISDGEREVHVPSTYPVKVVDTTGAGDAFCAGFLYGMIKGRGLKECAHLGEIMAAFCLRKLGARPSLPSRQKLEQEYKKYFLNHQP